MKCPACSAEMVCENFGVKVDVCENGCKGIWFEQSELTMLDEGDEGLGEALQAALREPSHNDGERDQLPCPKCSNPMHTHKFKRAQEVNVDECYNCGGFFLDAGELTEIRDNYMSDAEVGAYVDAIVRSVPEYAQAKQDENAMQHRLDAIQSLTQLLTVNYWRKNF